jgi:glycosyltransferase involved in cell wall biosynthesis
MATNGENTVRAGQGLSVVVPTRDRPQLLAACINAISQALRPGDELIVSDSGVPDAELAVVVAECGGRLVRSSPGASRQRNIGASQARHDVIAFIDDDVRVAPEWTAAVVEAFVMHPEVAFVTGRLEVPPEQEGYGRPVSIKAQEQAAVLTPETRGTLGHSANMAVRRAAFDRVGGFDERLGPGAPFRAAEDGDLIDRLFAAGYVGRYEPAARGWHDQWRTRNDLVKLEWSYGIGMGARLARLARADRPRARGIAGDYLWRNALKVVPSHVRRRNEYAVLFVLARVGGASLGFARAALSGFPSQTRAVQSETP